MSVLIKGIEMPKNCYECYFCTYGYCVNLNRYIENSQERDSDCPIIELPPHGRLIDADEMLEKCYQGSEDGRVIHKAVVITPQTVNSLPTILEAEVEDASS